MRFLRHLLGLFQDLFGFARKNKAWWIIPLVAVLLILALVVVAGKAVAPFIYTLF
jgi:hypothetical protein